MKEKYFVLSPIKHDGEEYAAGETIELNNKQAAAIAHAIKAVNEPKAKKSEDDKA